MASLFAEEYKFVPKSYQVRTDTRTGRSRAFFFWF
jgi:hypothetical protein